jgi:hypothetical protein
MLIYIVVAWYLISKAERKSVAFGYAVLVFLCGYVLFSFIWAMLVGANLVSFAPFYEDSAVHGRYQATKLVLGLIQTAASTFALYWILGVKGRASSNTSPKASESMIRRAVSELTTSKRWRLFVALQALAIGVLAYVDLTNRVGWDFLPQYSRYYGFKWDVLESSYWTSRQHNWVALLCVFGPLLLVKATAWVKGGEK